MENEIKSPPAFLFYPADWIGSTAEMTAAEKGVYIDLLSYQWLNGSLPADQISLKKLTGNRIRNAWGRLDEKFPINGDGRRRNKKLETVRAEWLERSQNLTKRGRAGAEKRWLKHSSSIEQAMPKTCLSSSSSYSIEEEPKNKRASVEERKAKARAEINACFDDRQFEVKLRTLFPRVNWDLERSNLLARVESHWDWCARRRDWKRTVVNWLRNAERFARERAEIRDRARHIQAVDAGGNPGREPVPPTVGAVVSEILTKWEIQK